MKKSAFLFFACSLALAVLAVSAADTKKSKPAASLRFIPFGQGLPVSGQWREGFRIADMNGDGHPDIVHGSQRKVAGPPVILLGDGKGSWAAWKEARFPRLAYDYGDIEVADFNRDGHLDVALAIHLHGLLVLMGDGQGGFSDSSAGLDFDAQGGSSFSSRALRAADWDGDGLPDLIAVSEGPRPSGAQGTNTKGIVVYLNAGEKGWRKTSGTLSPGIFSDSLTLGDFDGDGHLDVATGTNMMGRADLVNLWRANGTTQLVNLDFPNRFHYAQAVVAGDFDQDGKADLAVGYVSLENEIWYAAIDIFYSRPGGKWERRAVYREASKDSVIALAGGHLRDRNRRDLVALNAKGETKVFLSDGRGGFVTNTPALPVYGGGCRGAHVELADLDGDGRDEIVASFADEGPACPSGGGFAVWKAVAGKR